MPRIWPTVGPVPARYRPHRDVPGRTLSPCHAISAWRCTSGSWPFSRQDRCRPYSGRDAEWNRDTYLAGGLVHRQECHTPRHRPARACVGVETARIICNAPASCPRPTSTAMATCLKGLTITRRPARDPRLWLGLFAQQLQLICTTHIMNVAPIRRVGFIGVHALCMLVRSEPILSVCRGSSC